MNPGTLKMAPANAEVPMLAPEIVRQIEQLAVLGWGAKRIGGQLGVARGTVLGICGAEKRRRGSDAAGLGRWTKSSDPWRRSCSMGRPEAMRLSSSGCSTSAASKCRCGRCSGR